jgi:hypothetical protein
MELNKHRRIELRREQNWIELLLHILEKKMDSAIVLCMEEVLEDIEMEILMLMRPVFKRRTKCVFATHSPMKQRKLFD